MATSFLDCLRTRRLLSDGGMGTELARGHAVEAPFERWNVERPEAIASVHAAYLDAGCDAITTNSFCGDPRSLAGFGLESRAEEFALAAARLAREAADACASEDVPRFVLGSIGPGPVGAGSDADELEGVQRVAAALLAGGADALLLETSRNPDRTRAVLERLADLNGELLVSFTPLGDDPIGPLAEELEGLGVGLVGFNCVDGPDGLAQVLAQHGRSWQGPLGGWPNAGRPARAEFGEVWPVGPSAFATSMAELAERHDLRLVGGCCGTGPAHLAALRQLLPIR